jgi:hypothetical protein
MNLDNMTIAILVLAVLLLGWYLLKKKEGFLKCGASVGERTLLAMNMGSEGAPPC